MPNHENIIASREFDLAGSGKVTVYLYQPEPIGDDAACSYRIVGLPQEVTSHACGVDAFQAIYLALMIIGAYLYASEEWKSGRLTLFGSKNLALPLADVIKDDYPNPNT